MGSRLGLVLAVALALASGASVAPRGDPDPCEGPQADAWVAAYRDRLLAQDSLLAFATATFGAWTSCEGDSFDFEGATYGGVVLTLPREVRFESMTQPPRVVVGRLAAPRGVTDGARARDAIARYAGSHGLVIDWSAAEVEDDGVRRREQYWDPDPGLNGSVTLVFESGRLVEVGFAMAP